jgi:mannose/fructose/N-acetylgalactosamine-specific phosphotransferase system component IIB
VIVLVRIDDRLLHGQVAVGWAPALKATRIVIADDEVAALSWEADLYREAGPSGVDVRVLSLAAADRLLRAAAPEADRTILLVRSPEALLALLERGLEVSEVNVGGLHHEEERKQFLPYVWLSKADAAALRKIAARGVRLSARAVPGNAAVDLLPLLPKGRE